ncbi:Nif3-like dinuclear metal center hexameric protein [soil metagenome]
MKIAEILTHLESIAPVSLQESYDNAGLITGNSEWTCSGVLVCLDATEDVIQNAIDKKCNLVVAHHPIVFSGLKKITGKNYVERTVIAAIKNDIAIYAIHTNLDNVIKGVNGKIAEKLGLKNLQVLQPREQQLKKLITFAPPDVAENIRNTVFNAGGGHLGNYSECSFIIEGRGTFKPLEGADPFVGEIGKRHENKELKIEIIFPSHLQTKLVAAMIEAHPYEEVAYDIISLGNYLTDVGSGIIGEVSTEMNEVDLLKKIRDVFDLKVVKHTVLLNKAVKRVAVCGGSGSFLLQAAMAQKADVYITSDVKYHEFFDADAKILLADIGHFESEQYTIDLLYDLLIEKFPNFAVLKTEIRTNPVHYFL